MRLADLDSPELAFLVRFLVPHTATIHALCYNYKMHEQHVMGFINMHITLEIEGLHWYVSK